MLKKHSLIFKHISKDGINMAAIWEFLYAPVIVGGFKKYDAAKNVDYVQLGYPAKPSSPPSLSDMSYLAGQGLSVGLWSVLNINYLNFAVGEYVELHFNGPAGSSVSWSQGFHVKDVAGGDNRILVVPSAYLKKLAGQTATLHYVVTPTSGKVRTSGILSFEVRGLYLPAPEVIDAKDNTIDINKISAKGTVKYVTVSLDYPDMKDRDAVRLVKAGVDANQKAINVIDEERPVSSGNLAHRPLKFIWTDGDIRPLLNGSVDIYYQVYRDGIWYNSLKSSLYVGARLAGLAPYIKGVDGYLDPDTVIDYVYVRIPFQGTLVNDKVTMVWSDSSRQNKFKETLTVTELNVDKELLIDVYLEDTINSYRGKFVTVYYRLERTLPDGRSIGFNSPEYKFFVGNQQEREAADSRVLEGAIVGGVKNGNMDASLASAGTTLTVPFTETQEGDSVTAYWQLAEGGDPYVSVPQAVDAANVDRDLVFNIPAATVNTALNKKATAYYVIERQGADGTLRKFRSQETSFSVGPQLAALLLPAPDVPATVASVLDPMVARTGAKVVIRAYPSIAVGDTVRLFWSGTYGAGTPDIATQNVSSVNQVLEFDVPASAIGANTGAEVWVYYDVTRKGLAAPIESEVTVVEIEKLGLDDLSAPVIEQAPEGILDLVAVKADIVVKLKKWPFIAADQRVWLRLEGVAKDGSFLEINVWTANRLTDVEAQKDLEITVDRAEFDELAEGSPLRVFAKATLDGDFDDTYAEDFPVLNVVIKPKVNALSVESSEVSLTAAYPKPGSTATVPPGSSKLLVISGGTGPYTFESGDASVVDVDGKGLLMARKNGSVFVQVRDSAGQTVVVTVTVQGITTLEYLTYGTYSQCEKIARDRGLLIVNLATWRRLRLEAGGKLFVDFPDTPAGEKRSHSVWARDKWSRPGVQEHRRLFNPDNPELDNSIMVSPDSAILYGFGMKP
ncbi:hypothetical protein ALP05_01840 [Pseudomonas caricapapayae]|uniref:BIG2 domain-containing protein n=2 Tax=Pseudomonas caricapapayae TaxID=46678 RepID=A0A3M6F3H3_9PSED|nr:hypothetical protein ALP05_01840 [Pseudomonas caricapapayae]